MAVSFDGGSRVCRQVSPHELLQAVSVTSKKRFKIGTQSEAVEFLSWLLNQMDW